MLTPERWRTLSPHLEEVLELEAAARAAWLSSFRVTHPDLADDLETLVAEHRVLDAGGFLDEAPGRPHLQTLAGQVIGAYRLVSPLGHGGMGTVWLADRADGRFEGRVAVKLLNVGLAGQSGEERFAREGSILARLQHPSIAHLIDAGVAPSGQPYLVLEYVEGEHIDKHCERGALSIEARLRLFLEVLDAVAHAHANLVVHRDLKPSNVLVNRDGRVKLLDFGIAKLMALDEADRALATTADGSRMLTPEYAAPEQLTGEQITVATDVYALGVLLYVLLGGRHPAGLTPTPAALLQAILHTDPPPPSAVADVPGTRRVLRGDLDTIAGKALRKRPDERYASVAALADDVRRYLRREPVSARRQTASYHVRRFVQRHALAVLCGAAAILCLAGLLAYHTTRLAAERDRARVAADTAERVSTLLGDLLTAADPYARRDDREPTVRAVLDAGAARLQRDLHDKPAVRADLLTVVGRAYDRLGAEDRAAPLLRDALASARQAYGTDHARVGQALHDLGVVTAEAGDVTRAAQLLDEALAMRRRVLGSMHPDVASTLVERGRLFADKGLAAEAESMFEESLAIRRATLGSEHPETSTSLSEVGLMAWQRGDAAAEPLFRESLAISRRTLGTLHPNVATGLNNLALALGAQERWAEAEAASREGLGIARRVLGPDHRDLGPKLANLAVAQLEQGEWDDAARSLNEATAIAEATLGTGHPGLASYRLFRARAHLGKGESRQAEVLLRDVLAVRERAMPGSWREQQARSALGEALTLQRRYAEAEPLLRAALDALPDVPAQAAKERRLARRRLVALYEGWGRPNDADPFRD